NSLVGPRGLVRLDPAEQLEVALDAGLLGRLALGVERRVVVLVDRPAEPLELGESLGVPLGHDVLLRRGRGWHTGHENDERFMKVSRTTGVAQRPHGGPRRPWTASEREKYPEAPSTST